MYCVRVLIFSVLFFTSLFFNVPIIKAQEPTETPIPPTLEQIAKSEYLQLGWVFMGIIVFSSGVFIGKEIFKR